MSAPNDAPQDPDSTRDEQGQLGSIFGSTFALWIYFAVFLALVVHLAINWGDEERARIEYSTFLEYVESGYVAGVEIVNGTRIEGRYTHDAVEHSRVRTASPEDQGLLDSGSSSASRDFITTKPETHELTAFLRAHNDRVEQKSESMTRVRFTARTEDDWFGHLLYWLVPIALLAVAWFVVSRRTNSGTGMLNIGKSTATLFKESDRGTVTFADVAGLEEAKEEVAEVVHFLKSPEQFTRLGGQLPKGVLLVGPPGTGKTLLARAVAGEAQVPFFSISGSDFVEMFVGVGASRVRDLFETAKETAPCIIFIDEIDAVGRSRGGRDVAGGNDERENTLNQLLAEMDGFNSDEGVIIIGATNRPDVLDAALLRPGRFDRQILIEKPDRRARKRIFEVHIRDVRVAETVELEILARQTPGFAGAEIANVCNEAALLAARDEKDAVEMKDFERAIDRVVAGLEKKNKLISPEERELIAYHESGHAIVGWFLEHTDPVVKVSIVPRGMSTLGHALHLPEERYIHSTEALMDRMTMALGGRVAEKLVFDFVTTGAQSDLERITKLAYAMVTDYGMSDRIGDVSFNMSQTEDDTPRFDKPYSDATAEAIDEEVKDLIETARKRARSILADKRSELDEMAQVLLDTEVLGAEELVSILGERPHGEYVELDEMGRLTPEARRNKDDSRTE